MPGSNRLFTSWTRTVWMRSKQNGIPVNRGKILVELVIIFVLMMVVYKFAGHYDIMEWIVGYAKQHEQWQLDELITVAIFLVFALALFSIQRWRESLVSERMLTQSNKELQKALSELKQLSGIIPICMYCKKIRDDKESWHQLESYIIILRLCSVTVFAQIVLKSKLRWLRKLSDIITADAVKNDISQLRYWRVPGAAYSIDSLPNKATAHRRWRAGAPPPRYYCPQIDP